MRRRPKRSDFLEVEHKFLVGPEFDSDDFCARAERLGPARITAVEVADTYYVTALSEDLIFRHRFDAERQELTMKSRGSDIESRLEVNLRLDQDSGNQRPAVEAFLRPFSITWQGTIQKRIRAFYFPECEVVYYTASGPAGQARCVEFEATTAGTLEESRATLERYETMLGFAGQPRSERSLFELLLVPAWTAAKRA